MYKWDDLPYMELFSVSLWGSFLFYFILFLLWQGPQDILKPNSGTKNPNKQENYNQPLGDPAQLFFHRGPPGAAATAPATLT